MANANLRDQAIHQPAHGSARPSAFAEKGRRRQIIAPFERGCLSEAA